MTRLVYTAADSNYRLQAQVFLRSLSETQLESTHVIVFGSGWDSAGKTLLGAQAFGRVAVEVQEKLGAHS